MSTLKIAGKITPKGQAFVFESGFEPKPKCSFCLITELTERDGQLVCLECEDMKRRNALQAKWDAEPTTAFCPSCTWRFELPCPDHCENYAHFSGGGKIAPCLTCKDKPFDYITPCGTCNSRGYVFVEVPRPEGKGGTIVTEFATRTIWDDKADLMAGRIPPCPECGGPREIEDAGDNADGQAYVRAVCVNRCDEGEAA